MTQDTRVKLLQSALNLFLTIGIKKTTMDDIAIESGLTRVSVYRYFTDKRDIVKAAFFQIIDILDATLQEIQAAPENVPQAYLEIIVERLISLGRGDLPAGLEELKRVYPDIAGEFQQARHSAIHQIFNILMLRANQNNLLRSDLRTEIVYAYFLTAVIYVMENPELQNLGLPPAEIFSTVKEIFLNGVLKK
jgi:AcrR family transcriptional regulator